ncbi:hypothetical protein EG68_12095 [Paragonimus skrjabini miyazakii]|uniref:Uncharacterized protein n=1 Tax=Paragonimus skrjabini miyazakii TaxID=59628 RepID=A0A8S9YF43_9TREM|nr:hypothetical protein EG68_12095 [Paragonimus skrjabini miyazakii]
MYKQCQRCLTGDDALRLKLYLIENLSVRFLSSLAYEAVCHGSYQCLELIMKHQNFDAYFTIAADGSNLFFAVLVLKNGRGQFAFELLLLKDE